MFKNLFNPRDMSPFSFFQFFLLLFLLLLLNTPGKTWADAEIVAEETNQKPFPVRCSTFGTLGVSFGPDDPNPVRTLVQCKN